MTTIFDDNPDAVQKFQVYQRLDFSIEILYVPNLKFPNLDHVLDKIQTMMLKKTGGQIELILKEVKEIPQSGGKLKFIRSELM